MQNSIDPPRNGPPLPTAPGPRARPRRGLSCLLWLMGGFFALLLAGAAVFGAAYAGWDSGLATAQVQALGTSAAEAQRQCQRIPADLAAGNLRLAQTRLEALRAATPAPACLAQFAPTATAYALQAARPSATAARIAAPTAAAPASDEAAAAYDLSGLLAEAQAEISRRNYPAAIDTLAAIIGIDSDFQKTTVRRLYLDVLKSQAQILFRSGKLSEAIVLSTRAEAYGNIDELQYERAVAELYLEGQRYKTRNPAEAIRLFEIIVYEYQAGHYMNGQVLAELQDARRYYGDALVFQGEPCRAIEQYAAALNLQPNTSLVGPGILINKQEKAEQACREQPTLDAANGALNGTPNPLGAAPTAVFAPVGQQSG